MCFIVYFMSDARLKKETISYVVNILQYSYGIWIAKFQPFVYARENNKNKHISLAEYV